MKRLLILLVVLGLLMAFPATAFADKPDCSDPNSTHPSCGDGDDDLLAGHVCDPYNPKVGAFDVTLTAANPEVCIDWDPATSSDTEWRFTITASDDGGRFLWMATRDSRPGDGCYMADLWRKKFLSQNQSFFVDHVVPPAELDACDGLIGPILATDDAKSLVFLASMSGSESVTISVDLP